MESIKELRDICQSTRPSIFSDPLSKLYYQVSIYFTWVFILIRLNANQVTVLSGLVALIGGYLISSSSPFIVLIGGICFHLFAIFDMCDGEVARYRNEGGVEGHYLDWYMHFITPTALVIGLFLASFNRLDDTGFLFFGLVAIVIPLLSKSVQNAGWTVIVWTLLRNKKLNNVNPLEIKSRKIHKKNRSKLYKLARLGLTSPFEDRWSSILILLLPLIDLIFVFFNVSFLDYRYFWLLYMGIAGPIYIYLKVREMILYPSLVEGYNRIVDPSHKVTLPEDDFL